MSAEEKASVAKKSHGFSMEKNELFFTECIHAVFCLCLWNASHSPFVNHLFYVNRSLVFMRERALVVLVEWVNYETSSDL